MSSILVVTNSARRLFEAPNEHSHHRLICLGLAFGLLFRPVAPTVAEGEMTSRGFVDKLSSEDNIGHIPFEKSFGADGF
jgi:hypothetical protein